MAEKSRYRRWAQLLKARGCPVLARHLSQGAGIGVQHKPAGKSNGFKLSNRYQKFMDDVVRKHRSGPSAMGMLYGLTVEHGIDVPPSELRELARMLEEGVL